jgi:hypothetical protein
MTTSRATSSASATGRRRSPARRRTSGGRRRPGNQQWWPAGLVAVAVLIALAWRADGAPPPPGSVPTCALPGSAVTITPEQATNAAIIAGVAWERGLPDRAVVIALATAQQESGLRNIDYGDRDSLGLFQQRPSQGWGTEEQVQDPQYAAGQFLDRLVQVPGWQTGRLTEVAQTVQRSGFPEAYQKHEPMAIDLTAALRAGEGELDCG